MSRGVTKEQAELWPSGKALSTWRCPKSSTPTAYYLLARLRARRQEGLLAPGGREGGKDRHGHIARIPPRTCGDSVLAHTMLGGH